MKTKVSTFIVLVILLLAKYTIAQRSELVLPAGHTGAITSSAFSPDGKYIITGSEDRTAKIWEASSGRLIRTLVGHTDKVYTAEFSPNGKHICTASADKTCKVWDLKTGNLLLSLEGHEDQVLISAYSPDGKYIATGSKDKTAKLWDATSGKLFQSLEGERNEINNLIFEPSGKRLVTSAYQSTKIWEVDSGRLLFSLNNQTEWVFSLITISGDGTLLATASGNSLNIWDLSSGKLKRSFEKNQARGITAIRFTPDNRFLAIAKSYNSEVEIFEINTGELISKLKGHENRITHILFTKDGKSIVTCSYDNTAKIWETQTGKLIHDLRGHYNRITSITFSGDENSLLTTSEDRKAKIWNTKTGNIIHTFEGSIRTVVNGTLQDGKVLSTTLFLPSRNLQTNSKITVWNLTSLKPLRSFDSPPSSFVSYARYGIKQNVIFSPDGNYILIDETEGSEKATAKISEVISGKQIFNTVGQTFKCFSPDSKYLAEYEGIMNDSLSIGNGEVKVWEVSTGELLYTIRAHTKRVVNVKFSPDGKYLVTASFDKTYKVWGISTGKLLHTLEGHLDKVYTISFSANGKYLATSSYFLRLDTTRKDLSIKIWDVNSGKLLHNLVGPKNLNSVIFSPDSKYLITYFDNYRNRERTTKIWEVESGKLLYSFENESDVWSEDSFSPDGKYLVMHHLGNAKVLELSSGKFTQILESNQCYSSIISEDGKYLVLYREAGVDIWDIKSIKKVGEIDGQVKFDFKNDRVYIGYNNQVLIVDFKTTILGEFIKGSELVSLVPIDSVNWVVIHSSGLFDASPQAMEKLYFVTDLDIIEFSQLKARYYEPGLGTKVMNREKLRNVVGFKSIDLPPDIRVGNVDEKGYLPIELINRGGGIGEVSIYVNGKEVIKDARPNKSNPDAPSLSFKSFITNHKSIVKGEENFIAVKAWNKDHWVVSHGTLVSYKTGVAENYKSAIHILTIGVSDYIGEELDLKYASKDAEDISKALQLGAKQLFGTDKCNFYNLNTNFSVDLFPSKSNILNKIDRISSTAHPLDVFVMYLSGHGINFGGTDGDWYYLTQEAYTSSSQAYNDPAIRKQTTLSSNELIELFKKVPALKQVLIIDACASGRVVENLITQKDIPSNTLRALDRMRDRTGMHIITGCSADAVSYEASKYGQGVLTYSILEGIKGAALREEQYIDINKLFQYAQDRVPVLAQGIGGIQAPQIFSPQGSQSFDIGILTENEKMLIPLTKIRPVYIRSNFQDETELEDVLGLGKMVDDALNEVSLKNSEAKLIFVDVKEYPEGCKLIGRYQKDNEKIILKLRKKCGEESSDFEIKGNNIEQLKQELFKIF